MEARMTSLEIDQVAVDIRNRLGSMNSADPTGRLIAALGGPSNIAAWHGGAGRVSLLLRDSSLVDAAEVGAAVSRSAAFVAPQRLHIIAGPHQDLLVQHLSALLPAEGTGATKSRE